MFKKEDLKFGDIVTTRDGQKNIYLDECIVDKNQEFLYLSLYNKDLKYKEGAEQGGAEQYDIMNVERYIKTADGKYDLKTLYEREEEILNNKEKEYLSKVIEPFRKNIDYISKVRTGKKCYYIYIHFKDNADDMDFPYFPKEDNIYKGMKLFSQYTLEELGL